MDNKTKKQLMGMYEDVVSELIKAKKATKYLAISLIAGTLLAGFSVNLQKEKERKMRKFNDELDKIYMDEGDTTCDD